MNILLDAKAFQAKLGVATDGALGPATFGAMFRQIGAPAAIAAEFGIAAAIHFPAYGVLISTQRLAHFLAQLAHESDSFHAMEEYASGRAYEGRADLGNTQPGDGVRFKGRGPIQCTGRANYRRYGRAIGIDLERHPEIAAIPSIGLHIALEYWKDRGLNALADADDIMAITRKINGGLNGFAERKAWLAKVEGVIG